MIGLVGGAGATIGETTAYLAGYAGHNAATHFRWYPRIHDLMERHGSVTIFVVSVIPTPFFDLAGIAAGALNYPFRKFMVYGFGRQNDPPDHHGVCMSSGNRLVADDLRIHMASGIMVSAQVDRNLQWPAASSTVLPIDLHDGRTLPTR